MNTLLQKLQNRALYLYSSGSPLRYTRKLVLSAQKWPAIVKRRKLAEAFKDTDPQVLESVEENGYCDVSPELDESLYSALLKASEDRLKSSANHDTLPARKYFAELLNLKDRSPDNIFVRFALQEKILKIVSAQFGQVPQLFGVSLLLSKATPEDTWLESQLWHRDYDDSKILKLFVYLTDVNTKNDGPFTFIPPKTSAKVGRDFIPKRISDEEMKQRGGSPDVKEIFGKKGTGFLIDTARCYHMGSRCTDSFRLAYVAAYTTSTPLDHGMTFQKAQVSGELEKLVLDQ